MGVDDRPADRQPHPHAGGLGGVERLENAIPMCRLDARPGIAAARALLRALAIGCVIS
jgi:hypothetical protein